MSGTLYVIGSGPAGAACAHALLARGESVTMLDVGMDLEPAISREVDGLRRQLPQEWSEEAVQRIKGEVKATTDGVPFKYLYGSDYPYRGAAERSPLERRGTEVKISHAKGGCSTIWGAAMLPYLARDIQEWPITVEELAPYYGRVLELTGLSAVSDRLRDFFPLYTEDLYDLQPSSQASFLLKHMQSHEGALRDEGMVFGRARLAIRDKCQYCRLCLYGCPYGLIYNSAYTIDELRKNPRFEYRPGCFVDRVEEADGKVRVFVKADDGHNVWTGARAFLACGTLETARIMLHSQNPAGQLRVKDSHVFFLPALQWKGAADVDTESMHTMSQLFLEVFDPAVSKYTVHLQIFTYNEIYSMAVRNLLGPLFPLMKRPMKVVNNRLSLIMGFVHSEESSRMTLKMDGPRAVLERVGQEVPNEVVTKTLQKLSKNYRKLGFLPVGPMMKRGLPGKSNHHGSTFPMRRIPGPGETDMAGRPHGFERIHLVDSSVFPTVPATTITFTIMANAYRIGSECETAG